MAIGPELQTLRITTYNFIKSMQSMAENQSFQVGDVEDFTLDQDLAAGMEGMAKRYHAGDFPDHMNLSAEVGKITQNVPETVDAARHFLGKDRYEDFEARMNAAFGELELPALPAAQTFQYQQEQQAQGGQGPVLE